jgi:putative tricarboxylic transport membrane protein
LIETLLTILSGTLAGLITGLMPGLGSVALVLAAMPLLYYLPPEVCIIYYAVAIQASQFSGSVSAINFGMMGELTSYPALAERRFILDNNLQKTALRYTALGSMIACIIPIIMLYPLLEWFKSQTLLLRTDTLTVILIVILLFAIFYKQNKWWVNLLLAVLGVGVSQIGLVSPGGLERNFFTFGQSWLYGGVPMISVIGGLISVPLIVDYIWWNNMNASVDIKTAAEPKVKFPFFSVLRGSILGLFTGLIPAVGTQIGSNLAWIVEKKFKPANTMQDTIARLTSAESANNGSQITVLVPLLVLGMAIVPSEMILLGVLELKAWMPRESTWISGGFGFYPWLMFSLIVSACVSFLLSYTFLSLISPFLRKNLTLLNKFCIIALSLAVLYSGSLVENRIFFLASFAFCSFIAIYFRKVHFIPMVIGYFVGDALVDNIEILMFLWS